ncbi:MAG: nucleotidyl transferase AbiEii/AbiGii toxin family protein, partial [Candidatus Aenigmatarchaeota archaeon]
MNTKDFFARLNKIAEPKKKDIIEKDFHLHRLLNKLSRDEYFKENFVFKGGSCLVKAYTGYYRFSEDIDLTWKYRKEWTGLSASQTRKRCS